MTQPIHHPERFEALGLPAATGVLLYGEHAVVVHQLSLGKR